MNIRVSRPLFLITLLLSLCPPLEARAVETILSFHSDIKVEPSSDLIVTETIQVRAEGKKIKRGIYRDFPTRYRDNKGNTRVVGFDLLSVTRDGGEEPFHTQSQNNGVRIYIGDSDHYLSSGIYTYTLKYRTDRQIGFFDDFDELYWNVTGNGWSFPIEQASATVRLPETVPSESLNFFGYTGPEGSRGSAYRSVIGGDGSLRFETTSSLDVGEGFTIAVAWEKGHITAPSNTTLLLFVLRDHSEIVIGMTGLLILLIYYLIVWSRVGRDPSGGTVFPRFHPPDGISPAAARYIDKMGFDNRVFATALINLAVKGHITIHQEGKRAYTLHKAENEDKRAPSKGEQALYNKLLGTRKSLALVNTNHEKVSAGKKALKLALRSEFHQTYFRKNTLYMIPGVVITLTSLLLAAVLSTNIEALFIVPFIMIDALIFGVFTFLMWDQGRRLYAITFAVIGISSVVAGSFIEIALIGVFVLFGVLALTNVLFFFLLRAPSRLGRETMDQLEGFALYLETAEEDRLNVGTPPEKTPDLFERYLPFALALGVDQQWSEKFSSTLSQIRDPEEGRYQPHWYNGAYWDYDNPARFTSSMASGLSSAISAASTAPGSSSGSSGGGFSGGGGGGGGGGGW